MLVVFVDLESSCHEVGSNLTTLLMVMQWAMQEAVQLILILILIAFITGNSSLEPLIEGLCAQIHVNLR